MHELLSALTSHLWITFDEFGILIRIRAVQMHSELAVTKHVLLFVKNVRTDRLQEKLSPPTLPKALPIALWDGGSGHGWRREVELVKGDTLMDQHSGAAITTRYFFPVSSGQGYWKQKQFGQSNLVNRTLGVRTSGLYSLLGRLFCLLLYDRVYFACLSRVLQIRRDRRYHFYVHGYINRHKKS